MAVCPRCATDNSEAAKFCSECGAPLAAPVQREQRKVVTVLFCDVAGSTALGERTDPEALRGIMARYFDAARTAIERHGGTVEKFIGDAVMAVFGVPTVHEDDALRAVRAAVELRDAVEIDVRIGVNTGEVVTGGGDTLVTGDAVNVAARLEQAAGAGELYVGATTYALVRDAIDAELLPPLDAKGKSEPLAAYRVRAVTGELRRRNAAPMVGRTRELELLTRAFERAQHERGCHLFTLLGPAGMGKSRLVTEFLAGLSDASVVHGRCLSYGEGITYWPVVEVVKQLPSRPDDATIRSPLAALLGEGDTASTPPEIAWAVRKAFEHAARNTPLVVVFDDIQWGESVFLDLIEHVADLSRGAPILLLCMARPELLDVRPGWGGGKLNATSVLLEPLAADETAVLVRTLVGTDEGLVAKVASAADGNPLFVEEMVELARTSDGDVAVPPTIQALLTARLDNLPAAERAVLERGAVEGQVFHRGAVAALAPDEQQVDSRLVSLVRKELVRPDSGLLSTDDAYRFRHLLIRDAAYEALPKATRIELHRRFAERLGAHGDDIVELDEIVGYHLEQAARYARELGVDDPALALAAADRLEAAAGRAQLRADADAVANLLERAVALRPANSDAARRLVPRIAEALFDAGRLEESLRRLDVVPDDAYARAIRAYVTMWSSSAPFAAAVEKMHEAMAQLAGPERSSIRVYLAIALMHLGRTAESVAMALAAVGEAKALDDASLVARAFEGLMAANTWSATPWAETLTMHDAAKPHSVGPRTVARLAAYRGRMLWSTGDFDAGRAVLAEAMAMAVDLGGVLGPAGISMSSAHLERMSGNEAGAEQILRSAWEELAAAGETGLRSTVGGMLGVILAGGGRLREAQQLLQEAASIAAPDDYVTSYTVHAGRAIVALRGDDPAGALKAARQAMNAVSASDSPDHYATAALYCAPVLVEVERREEAARILGEVVARATARGSIAFADRARALLQITV